MAVEITTADRGMLRYVLANLRQRDALEMAAAETDVARLPDLIMYRRILAFGAYDMELGPVAAWGAVLHRKNVAGGFAFGTDNWGMALLPMLRHIRKFVLPFLVQQGFHRVEALAMAHRQDVARFMSLVGAQPEGVLRSFGVNGEDFISYRWLIDEYRGERFAEQHVIH